LNEISAAELLALLDPEPVSQPAGTTLTVSSLVSRDGAPVFRTSEANVAKIDLVKDFEAMVNGSPALERVRLDASETAIIPFTAEAERVEIHYCKEPDINDYVICNGVDCFLCKIAREKTVRLLLPVYLPVSGVVGVLPVGTSLRPRSLWPQLAQVLKDGSRMAVFISRLQGDSYTVAAEPLRDDVEDGAEVINAFRENRKKGTIQLDSVYPKVSNEQLAAIPEIDRMLKLRGIKSK
jgi:hypothetical protein